MEVLVTDEQEKLELDIEFIKSVALAIMGFIKSPENAQLSMVFCDDESIKALNNDYRGKNEPTDVLSFPIELENFVPEVRMLGDIVISTDTAFRQADEYKHSVIAEIVILMIHGLLHLHGYDHIEEDDMVKMRAKEAEVLNHLCSHKRFPQIGDLSTEPLIERASK